MHRAVCAALVGELTEKSLGFINTKKVLYKSSTLSTYTAEENCFITINMYTNSGTYPSVTLDDAIIFLSYMANNANDLFASVYCKKGQTVKINQTRGFSIKAYALY